MKWWKILGIVLLAYTIIAGFLVPAPRLDITNETIRNQYFHVPMWFAMMIILLVSVIYSIKYLRSNKAEHDFIAVESANVGILFGILGITTGMLWAQYTWGAFWNNDPKQTCAAIGLLVYFAYIVLRNSIEEEQTRARISAVYNIFAFPVLIALLYVIPRYTDSLHPGNGGNPGFNMYDLDSKMRMIFYPAIIGWTLLGVWVMEMRYKLRKFEFYNN
ncbi:MAG TPA: cytochrome c biogenesis protein CcsA [Cytophagaceae bacterium]